MRIVRTERELREVLDVERRAGRTIGLVPTMGALHEGHLSLVRLAHESADVVVVSVFVNPLQFGEGEDYEHYPRDTEGDLELLEGERADIAFLPSVDAMYPADATVVVKTGPLGEVFEGAARPGHFDGVCTVVTKLFHLVEPDTAIFGQKDAQQVAVLSHLVKDLNFRVRLIEAPIVREGDGLAMSSRNAYLTIEQREQALALSRSLQLGRAELERSNDASACERAMREHLAAANGVAVSYAAAVDPVTFGPPGGGGVLLIVAARVGTTRLIDNELVARAKPGTRNQERMRHAARG
ncbi:MAG: pantoate--beta-alanine ligase [Actinomycetota bacterium]